jgi:hypothetical protein
MLIDARDAQGSAVTGTMASLATVTGVRMSNGQPLLLIGDVTVNPKDVLEFH